MAGGGAVWEGGEVRGGEWEVVEKARRGGVEVAGGGGGGGVRGEVLEEVGEGEERTGGEAACAVPEGVSAGGHTSVGFPG